MKLKFTASTTALALLGASVAINACTVKTVSVDPGLTTYSGDGGLVGEGGASGDANAPVNEPPHALGRILLGEFHDSGSGTATPIISVGFTPDAQATKACTTQVAGCTMNIIAKCDSGSGKGCAANEACTLDPNTCAPACVPVCSMECSSGEECYFPSPSSPACRKTETFDAGALAFAGTTTPLTLFPPYSYEPTSSAGALFLAGAALEVQGSGAADVGFAKFDEKFTATQFIQTNPALNQIPQDTIFGTGSIPVGWVPGQDQVIVTVSGVGGSATCTADDTTGKFEIPRALVAAVLGDGISISTLSISVGRQRTEVKKDAMTKGMLVSATVQPVGWLELVTSSTESTSLQACPASVPNSCNGECVNFQNDIQNCGSCGNTCSGTDSCNSGQCGTGNTGATCDTCAQSAQTGACQSQFSACSNDSDCAAYQTCVNACASSDTTCQQTCSTTHATGSQDFSDYASCICTTACATPCASQCGN